MAKRQSPRMSKDEFYREGFHKMHFSDFLAISDARNARAYLEHCQRRRTTMEKTKDEDPHYCEICLDPRRNPQPSDHMYTKTKCCNAHRLTKEEALKDVAFRIEHITAGFINPPPEEEAPSEKVFVGVDFASGDSIQIFRIMTEEGPIDIEASSRRALRRKLRKMGLSIRDFQ